MDFNFLYILFIIIFVLIFYIIDKKYYEDFASTNKKQNVTKPSSSKPSSSKPKSSSSKPKSSSSSVPSPFSIFKSNIMKQYNLDSESIRNLSNLSSKIYNSSTNVLTFPGYLNIQGTLNIFPVGQIAAYSIQPNPHSQVLEDPPGWLICDGRTVQKSLYLNLYNILKSSNANNSSSKTNNSNSDTFQIPDYRGLFLKGAENNNVHKYSKDCIQDHIHYTHNPNHQHTLKLIRYSIARCCYNENACGREKHCFGTDHGEVLPEVLGYTNETTLDNLIRYKYESGKGLTYQKNQRRGKTDYLKGEANDYNDYPETFNKSYSNITLPKIIGVPVNSQNSSNIITNSPNVSQETRPYNWSINWIIKY